MLLIGLLFWFGVRLLHELIRTEMDEIQKFDVLREHKGQQLQRLPELEKQNVLIEERGKDLEIILTKDELVEFIRTLEQLAYETGVTIDIASKDNTLLESKITLPLPGVKNQKTVVPAEVDEEVETTSSLQQPKRGSQQSGGMLNELSLKHYIRLALTVTAPYKSMVAYLHKLETLPYATEIIGITIKEALKETEEAYAREGGIALPPGAAVNEKTITTRLESSLTTILDTEFDMLVYTQE